MKFNKITISLMTFSLLTLPTYAKNQDIGKFYGKLKIAQVIHGKHNGYDLTTGSAYYLNLGYRTKRINGFSFKISAYTVGDTGYTKTDKNENVAKGMFMGKATSNQDAIKSKQDIQDLFVDYKGYGYKAKIGHFELNTPMTKNATSTVPDLYEGLILSTNKFFKNTNITAGFLTRMAYGARAISEWGKISEKKGNAGSIKVNSIDDEEPKIASSSLISPSDMLPIRRGEFTNFGIIGGADKKIDGLAIMGLINKSFKNTTIQAWDYYAKDVVNMFYVDFIKKVKLQKNLKTMLGGQVLTQKIEGLSGTPTLFGAKAGIKYNNIMLTIAYNKSNSKQIMNTWGGDPAYTSSKFSRNAYRPNVKAYKVIAKYKPTHKLLFIATYAKYGKSSLAKTQKDATESDFAIKYKINKKLKLAISRVLRRSEFDGLKGKDKTQDYTTMSFVWKF